MSPPESTSPVGRPLTWVLAGLGSGVFWMVGLSLAFGPPGSRWTTIAAVYVVLGSLLLAVPGRRALRVLALWVVAVGLWMVLLAPQATGGSLVVAALLMASILFGLWYGTALLAVNVVTGEPDVGPDRVHAADQRRAA